MAISMIIFATAAIISFFSFYFWPFRRWPNAPLPFFCVCVGVSLFSSIIFFSVAATAFLFFVCVCVCVCVCVWLFFLCVSDPQIGHHLPDGSACFLTPLLLSICLNMIMFFSQSIFRLLYERFLLACFFVSHLYCGVMNYLPVFGNSFIFHFYF